MENGKILFPNMLWGQGLNGKFNLFFDAGQSWSGSLAQMNLWDFSIEKWDIENIAECRSDVFGNVVKVREQRRNNVKVI